MQRERQLSVFESSHHHLLAGLLKKQFSLLACQFSPLASGNNDSSSSVLCIASYNAGRDLGKCLACITNGVGSPIDSYVHHFIICLFSLPACVHVCKGEYIVLCFVCACVCMRVCACECVCYMCGLCLRVCRCMCSGTHTVGGQNKTSEVFLYYSLPYSQVQLGQLGQ